MKISNINKLRLALLLRSLIIFLCALIIVLILAKLDETYHISEKLCIHFDKKFGNHEIIFPSMSNTLFIAGLMTIVLSITSTLFYQFYFQYKYKKEKLETKTLDKKKIVYEKLVHLILFSIISDICGFLSDEFTTSLENSLENSNLKEGYFWLVYLIILVTMIISYFLEMGKNHLINETILRKINNKKDDKNLLMQIKKTIFSQERIKELAIIFILSLIILLISFGISKLPKICQFDWAPTICGQKIQIISNENNMLLLIIIPIILFALTYNFVIPFFEGKISKDSDKCDIFKKASSSVLLSVGTGFSTITSTCAINSLQSMDLKNPISLLPLVILGISSIVFAFFTIKQFEKENKNEKDPSSKFSYGNNENMISINI